LLITAIGKTDFESMADQVELSRAFPQLGGQDPKTAGA